MSTAINSSPPDLSTNSFVTSILASAGKDSYYVETLVSIYILTYIIAHVIPPTGATENGPAHQKLQTVNVSHSLDS